MAVTLAIFRPAKGKEKEVEEMLVKLSKKVREKEPKIDIFKPYKVTRHLDGCPGFCVYERYPDEKTLEEHRNSEHYKGLICEATAKGHLAASPHYHRVSSNTESTLNDMLFWRNLGYDDWKYLYCKPER